MGQPKKARIPKQERRNSAFEKSTPSERALQARLAAHTRWANETNPSKATAPARKAFLDRFERQVDPEGALEPAERARRAEHARKAYFAKLALKSAQVRRRTKEAQKAERSGKGYSRSPKAMRLWASRARSSAADAA